MDKLRTSCPECGTEIEPGLLSCPSCAKLLHGEQLKKLAAEAAGAEQMGDLSAALAAWREALDLLPPEARQHQVVLQKIRDLSARVDEGGPVAPKASVWKKGAAGAGALGLLLLKFKSVLLIALTKGKFLLLGLTKLPTLLSMLVWVGVYWSIWGWKFAAGIGVSIYIHEMGHIWMLRRYGIKSTAPMFIPGFGALVRLHQYPVTVIEDARVGLAGPLWGLAAAAGAFGIYVATQEPFWGAIAQFGAMINLFNMIPIWQLDGGRGFRSLTRGQRWLAVLAVGVMYYFTTQSHAQNVFLLIIGLCAVGRATMGEAPTQRDDLGLFQYILLILTLGALAALEVPGLTR